MFFAAWNASTLNGGLKTIVRVSMHSGTYWTKIEPKNSWLFYFRFGLCLPLGRWVGSRAIPLLTQSPDWLLAAHALCVRGRNRYSLSSKLLTKPSINSMNFICYRISKLKANRGCSSGWGSAQFQCFSKTVFGRSVELHIGSLREWRRRSLYQGVLRVV